MALRVSHVTTMVWRIQLGPAEDCAQSLLIFFGNLEQ